MKIFRVVINTDTNDAGIVFSPTGEKANGLGNANPTCRYIVPLDPALIKSLIDAAQAILDNDLKEVPVNTPAAQMTSSLHQLRSKRQDDEAKIKEEKAKSGKK